MKLKKRFREIVLLIRKQKRSIRQGFRNEPEIYYAAGLVLLWVVVFIVIHIKYLINFK
jgi:hypothetical protein